MIDLFVSILQGAGLGKISVHVNSLGDDACRPVSRERLREYFAANESRLCPDCRERLKTNPLRILDCKVPSCQEVIAGAPGVLESLCGPCREHFAGVRETLGALGIDHEVAPRLVRGLDYYTRTVFEAYAEGLGAQNAVGGGGRYDQLVRDFGGPATPAIGFSIGMERLLLSTGGLEAEAPLQPDVCLVAREPGATAAALRLARSLRGLDGREPKEPLRVMVDLNARSASAQMKWASKVGARFVVFVPPEEGGYAIRDMEGGKDEARQAGVETLREWLRERCREAASGAAR
jgi:histidyl-tRNA synthetase